MTVALITVLTIILCALNLFMWLNQRTVWRQRKYEDTRLTSTSAIDESGFPGLDIFNLKEWCRWWEKK